MKVFAHRGLSSLYPENTICAFEKALEYKVDGIETDVQLTKDGELVIMHDEWVDRTTNGKGFVNSYTLEEIRKLNANNGMEGEYKVPTLRELFDLIKGKDIILNLELKTSIFEYDGIEQKVYDLMKEYGYSKNIIISSFNHYSLKRFKEIAPEIYCGVLTGDRIIDFADYCKKNGFEALHPLFVVCQDPTYVKKAHELGLEVNVWTIDDKPYFDMCAATGVDVIMTNSCHLFTEKK